LAIEARRKRKTGVKEGFLVEEGLFGQGVDEVDAEALPSFHPPIQMQKWTWRWFHLHSADERGEVELRDVSLSFPAFLFDSEYTFFF
jgi:hypothetical protein